MQFQSSCESCISSHPSLPIQVPKTNLIGKLGEGFKQARGLSSDCLEGSDGKAETLTENEKEASQGMLELEDVPLKKDTELAHNSMLADDARNLESLW